MAWIGPIAVVALGIADLSGVIPAPLWGVPLLVNLLVGATAARRAYATIAEVVTEQRAIAAYAGQLELLATADFTRSRVAAISRNGWEPASAARRPCCAAWDG